MVGAAELPSGSEGMRILVAVPVTPLSTARVLSAFAHDVVYVRAPEPFDAVGCFYESFPQTTDEEVCAILEHARARQPVSTPRRMP